ncbi:hypothetical protein OG394_34950 [Kribbella sp. NBC_01245]|uniref:hypothetical protein n=1 Tax=Kribbella sp. NBC_01245 TaxID=2903578 RepID=UPI002E2A5D76|nr:hypothetical protein [Kribbella sp. NBC_01245]
MSTTSEIISAAGPYVLAGGTLIGAYLSTRKTGRESRHTARVEQLYQDMLDYLEHRYIKLQERQGRRAYLAPIPTRALADEALSISRIRLYATPAILERWSNVNIMLSTLELEGHMPLYGDEPTPYDFAYDASYRRAVGDLAELMRRDIGVPPNRIHGARRRAKRVKQWALGLRVRLGLDAEAQRGNGLPTFGEKVRALCKGRPKPPPGRP